MGIQRHFYQLDRVDLRVGELTATFVWVIFIRKSKRQTLTKKTLSANPAHCNTKRDPRNSNVFILCLHDNICPLHNPGLNHVNLNGRNNNPLVLITGIKLKSMWPKYDIWDYSIYCLLVTKIPSVYPSICCSIWIYPNASAKTSLSSTEHTEAQSFFFFFEGSVSEGTEKASAWDFNILKLPRTWKDFSAVRQALHSNSSAFRHCHKAIPLKETQRLNALSTSIGRESQWCGRYGEKVH